MPPQKRLGAFGVTLGRPGVVSSAGAGDTSGVAKNAKASRDQSRGTGLNVSAWRRFVGTVEIGVNNITLLLLVDFVTQFLFVYHF